MRDLSESFCVDIASARFYWDDSPESNVVVVIPNCDHTLIACPHGHLHEGPALRMGPAEKEITKEQARQLRPALAQFLDSLQ